MGKKSGFFNGIKFVGLFVIAVIAVVVFLFVYKGGSTSTSTGFSTDDKNDVAINNVKVTSACQSPSDQNEQHFLVHHDNKYYLVNYTGDNGDSAVEGSTISFKGDSDGEGNVTDSLVNMGMDDSYEGTKVEIVEVTKSNLKVNKTE